jgi:APA family basic amino acid/polyamine antiporter
MIRRYLGVPWLFAIVYASVGFSIYFALGLVAERGLGLTPIIFLGAGLLFVLTTLTYVEAGAMFRERGGSSTMARHAFDELVSFVAGWAILIDYMIVIALAAISVPHYMTPIWDGFGEGVAEPAVAVGVIALVAAVNVLGFTGRARQRGLVVLAIADIALQLLVIAVGIAVVFDSEVLTQHLNPFDPFATPSVEDTIYAFVIATVAFAGIEAASDLAPDLDEVPRDLSRVVTAGAVSLPLFYAAIAVVALMALPVTIGSDGPTTALGEQYIEEPVLGVVQAYEPAWLADAMQWPVALIAPVLLVWAASASMLGLSRHVYVLATNRQIPSWLGKLSASRSTPHIAIGAAAVICVGLVLPGDVRLLAGVYAFGATVAILIAHASIVRLRITDPDRPRPFRIPLNLTVGGRILPLPALFAGAVTAVGLVGIVVFDDGARYVGGGWMLFGLVAYVIYRRGVEKTSLTERVEVPEQALFKDVREAAYGDILVPIFGTRLDDDIVGTAGRLALAADAPGTTPPGLEVVYVLDLPLTVPLDAPPPAERIERANAAIARASDVGEEYDAVEVATSVVRARETGAGIVQAARERNVDLIVMGGEPPSKVRGGAVLGGIGGSRPEQIGPVTEYVLRKAPCRVLVTAPGTEPSPAEEPAASS